VSRAAVVVAAACAAAPAVPPPRATGPAVAITIYGVGEASYAVVDERRAPVRDGAALVLEGIDPRAELASLVIEPVGGAPLALGPCLRDRVPGGATVIAAVRCAPVAGGAGELGVRYVVPQLGVRVVHAVTVVAADRAELVTSVVFATPALGGVAELTVLDGAPGGDRVPQVVARGAVVRDGAVAVVRAPARTVAVRLRRIAAVDDTPRRHAVPVRAWLELGGLTPGSELSVTVAIDGEPAATRVVRVGGADGGGARERRWPLWDDDEVSAWRVGARRTAFEVDRHELAVANRGTVAREVWIEGATRREARRIETRAWPGPAELAGDRVAVAVRVRPGEIAHAGYAIRYAE
jgi:hypothetical protein